jgi:hypothetical protein
LSPRLSTTPAGSEATASSRTAHGRRGAGTQNHCFHGKDAVIEDVIDWRPFDYVTLTALLPIPGALKILMSYTFEDGGDGGTHFEFRIAKPKPKDLPFYEQIRPAVLRKGRAGWIRHGASSVRTASDTSNTRPSASQPPQRPSLRAARR